MTESGCLRGVSSGDMAEALQALVGADAGSLSAQALGRLKSEWKADHTRWQVRDLSARSYVYLWADAIYFQGAWRMPGSACWC